jgi:Flp pilus assembly protein TadG
MKRRTANIRRSEEGAVAVEFGLAMPVFLLLFLGVVEFGLALFENHQMLLAVSQAGRQVMVSQATAVPCDIACAQAAIEAAAPFATGSASLVANDCFRGMQLTATSNSNLGFAVPLVLSPVRICVPLL